MILLGTLLAFDAGTFLSTVKLDGSGPSASPGIAVNRGIAAADMVVGRRVVVSDSGAQAPRYVVLAVVA